MTHPNLNLKLMIIGRRKPGTTLAEHRHHIRQVHGELVLRYIATDPANAPQRYVQHAVFDGTASPAPARSADPGSPGSADPFALGRDFVTQVWAADFAALARGRETAFYREHLQGDEDRFVDQASVVFLPVRERELPARAGLHPVPPAGAVKLFGLLRCADGADPAAFARAWAEAASALHRLPAAAAVLQHTQNDVLARSGAATPLHGIDEFWLADEAAARALLLAWRQTVHAALAGSGLVADGVPLLLLAREDVVHAGPR
jgi:hypothetical protein